MIKTLNQILLAIDLHEENRKVIQYAIDLANQQDSKLIVCHIDASGRGPMGQDQFHPYFDEPTSSLTRLKKLALDYPNLNYSNIQHKKNIDYHIFSYRNIAEGILEMGKKQQVDLIILRNDPSPDLIKKFFGPISKTVILNSKIPILYVPGDIDYSSIDHIILSSDDAEATQQISQSLIDFAEAVDGQLDLVHVLKNGGNQANAAEQSTNSQTLEKSRKVFLVVSDSVTQGLQYFVSRKSPQVLAFTIQRKQHHKYFNSQDFKRFLRRSHIPVLFVPK